MTHSPLKLSNNHPSPRDTYHILYIYILTINGQIITTRVLTPQKVGKGHGNFLTSGKFLVIPFGQISWNDTLKWWKCTLTPWTWQNLPTHMLKYMHWEVSFRGHLFHFPADLGSFGILGCSGVCCTGDVHHPGAFDALHDRLWWFHGEKGRTAFFFLKS